LSRNDVNRVGAPSANTEPPIDQGNESTFDPLSFVTPTEFVELPSKGECYSSGHPLSGEETIEIKFMTAKEEDILSSRALLKKGIAVERFLESIIKNKKVKPHEMLVGDRNAILIAARTSGYGNVYETSITCPACSNNSQFAFDLNNKKTKFIETNDEITNHGGGIFGIKMPFSKFNINFRLLTGDDETYLAKLTTSKRKSNSVDSVLTEQYKRMVVSVEGHTDRSIVSKYVDAMPTLDSRHLRKCYKLATPDVNIIEDFECLSCGHEQELEVPFGADFFWPDR
jgi:hypothetical protein